MKPLITAAETEAMIRGGLPMAQCFDVLEVRAGQATCRLRVDDSMQRPGGTVSGPMLFTAADAAMYAVILAHLGPTLLAVTTDTTIHFLRKPALVNVIAEARLLKLGKRLVVVHVELFSEGADEAIACATGTYSIPST